MTPTPPQRFSPWLAIVSAFVGGVLVGLIIAATWEVERTSRQSERTIAETIATAHSRPTLDQRLEGIEQRLQAIEQRLTP